MVNRSNSTSVTYFLLIIPHSNICNYRYNFYFIRRRKHMKKFLALIFSSTLILGACGSNDTSDDNSDTKSESKTEKKSEDKKTINPKKKRNLKKMKIINLHKKIILLKNKIHKKLLQMNKFNLNNKHNKHNNLQLKSNNKFNKMASTIALNTAMNTTLVIRFQLMMIGHLK